MTSVCCGEKLDYRLAEILERPGDGGRFASRFAKPKGYMAICLKQYWKPLPTISACLVVKCMAWRHSMTVFDSRLGVKTRFGSVRVHMSGDGRSEIARPYCPGTGDFLANHS